MKYSYYFDDIFPTKEDWMTWVNSLGIEEVPESFHVYIYNTLSNMYNHHNIRYMEKAGFVCALRPIYERKIKKLYRQKQMIDNIYQLTMDEIIEVERAITNQALNPNDEPADPLAPLPYVSNQTYTTLKSNKLRAYLQALEEVPELDITTFVYGDRRDDKRQLQINDLFTNIDINNIPVYKED